MLSSMEEIINARNDGNTTKHDHTPIERLQGRIFSTRPWCPEEDESAVYEGDGVDRNTPFAQRPASDGELF